MSESQAANGQHRAAAAAAAGPPAREATPAALYLDLLKRCLTRYGLEEDLTPVSPLPEWRKRIWPHVERLLASHDWVVFRRAAFRPELRDEGLDWPRHAETMIGMRRLDNLQDCIERAVADGVAGDLLEAGVWRGGASIFMRAVLAALGERDRVVWVADSFQGLPKPDPKYSADNDDLHWTQATLAVSLDQVKANFDRYHMLDDQVRFLPGWFSETLPKAPIERLAVLRADGDMYGSTMDILNSLYPKLAVGGFAIIDDYGAIAACRQAVDDYRREHGISEPIERVDWTGVYWRRER
jgi:O-methyltransferase